MALAQQAQRKIDLMPWLPDNTPNEAKHDMNSEPAGHARVGRLRGESIHENPT